MENKKNWPIFLTMLGALLFGASLLTLLVVYAITLHTTARINDLADQVKINELGSNNIYVRFVGKLTDHSLLNGHKTVKQGEVIILDTSQAVGIHTIYDSQQGIRDEKISIANFLTFNIPGRSGLWRACKKGPTAFVVQTDGEINFQLLEYPVTGYLSATKTTDGVIRIGWAKIIYKKTKWLPNDFCQPVAVFNQ